LPSLAFSSSARRGAKRRKSNEIERRSSLLSLKILASSHSRRKIENTRPFLKVRAVFPIFQPFSLRLSASSVKKIARRFLTTTPILTTTQTLIVKTEKPDKL